MKSWSAALLLACITLLDASIVAAQSKAKLPLGLDPDATYIPDDNPMTPEKIALGKKFFWDKRKVRQQHRGLCELSSAGSRLERSAAVLYHLRQQADASPRPNPRQPPHRQLWTGLRPSLEEPLGLSTQEQADLVAFLHALTGQIDPEVGRPPTLPQ